MTDPVRDALSKLVELKDIKRLSGPTADYRVRKDAAWAEAREALAETALGDAERDRFRLILAEDIAEMSLGLLKELRAQNIRIPLDAAELEEGCMQMLAGSPCAAGDKILKDVYDAAHRACPKCGSTGLAVTYIGYVATAEYIGGPSYYPAGHRDENEAKCTCGWKGICHDLKPAAET